jgi:hypothetical protein
MSNDSMSSHPNPYQNLPASAFWKSGVVRAAGLEDIYVKKWEIPSDARIATAGSCFAQHITHHMRRHGGFNVLDMEPAPPTLLREQHSRFGFGLYSARYGNIYTVPQLVQLAAEVEGSFVPQNAIWERAGRYFDALRPSVEPEGLDSEEEVRRHREYHLGRVREMFETLDVFVFTLGMSEVWIHRPSGTVYPTAPGTIAGTYHPELYECRTLDAREMSVAFGTLWRILTQMRGGAPWKTLLTVSPVPMTATASGRHVLRANTHSKATLRTVAGYMADNDGDIDYFPSYEMVTNPAEKGSNFADNLRSVRPETVATVMRTFFGEHDNGRPGVTTIEEWEETDEQCEDALLEAFGG